MNWNVFPYSKVVFTWAPFQNFFFSLVFRILIMICLIVDFFLSCLEFSQLIESIDLMSLAKLGTFLAMISSSAFSAPPSFFSARSVKT